MALSTREIARVRRAIAQIEQIIDVRPAHKRNGSKSRPSSASNGTRTRRSGTKLVQFRRMLKAERKKGIPVMKLANKHGVSPAYIYQLG